MNCTFARVCVAQLIVDLHFCRYKMRHARKAGAAQPSSSSQLRVEFEILSFLSFRLP